MSTHPKMSHTPEPWHVTVDLDGRECVSSADQTILVRHDDWHGPAKDEMEANAARIVACVNAMAGIADPEGAIQAAREAMTMLANVPGIIATDRRVDEATVTALTKALVKMHAALAALGGAGGGK